MELIIQPGAGVKPILDGIEAAQKTIQIVIFRFDRGEIEAALTRAARRGVFVHALVAYKSEGQGGERALRSLEMRLLADGISVARTATDLVRYHDKLMMLDEKRLYMLGFNYTYIDTERSRSFGLVTEREEWVREAVKLFNADATRQPYAPECDTFLVSPGNSRQKLTEFIAEAKENLLIYDGKLTDLDILKLLYQKAKEGVTIRVIGAVGKHTEAIAVAPCPMRLHAQVVMRDGSAMYLGSQSLRTLELDARREVGVVLDDATIVGKVQAVFEADWAKSRHEKLPQVKPGADELAAIAEEEEMEDERESNGGFEAFAASNSAPFPTALAVKEAVKEAIKEALMEAAHEPAAPKELKAAVKEAMKEAVQEMSAALLPD